MESNPAMIQSQVWHVAKDTAFADEYEDAFCVEAQYGRAAIADGVSSAIFSGRWARLLTRRVVEHPPNPGQPDAWVNWLAEPRRLWLEDIDFPRMPPHQKQKLRQVGGSFCTLCWVEFLPILSTDDEVPRCLLRSFALGDSCLLHVRSGELLRSFPLKTSDEFDLDPDSICSVATSRDGQQALASTEFECLDGDTIILVTDAIAKWMLSCVENGDLTPWQKLWGLDEWEWAAAVERLRETNFMKRDDTTMVVLKIGEGMPPWRMPSAGIESILDPMSVNEESGSSPAEESSTTQSTGLVEASLRDDTIVGEVISTHERENGETGNCAEQCSESTNEVAATAVSETAFLGIGESGEPMGA